MGSHSKKPRTGAVHEQRLQFENLGHIHCGTRLLVTKVPKLIVEWWIKNDGSLTVRGLFGIGKTESLKFPRLLHRTNAPII